VSLDSPQAESGDGSRKVHPDLRANELADDSINPHEVESDAQSA